jgi:surface protein
MFSICESLRGLNLSTFRTENVTDMNSMFQYCSNLQVLDISSFSTSAVKNMGRMFMECRALAMLDVSEFDTARVTDMSEMFFRCSSLRELDLSSFIMSKVSDISGMFFKCASITDLKLSRFDTAMDQELKRDSLFEGCTMLSDVYFDGTEAEWSAAGLGETLPESATVHFAQAEVIQPESEEMKHIWGDYVPEGTATIVTKDGTEYTAIANSLVRKARGIEPSRFPANLYSGYDNPSEDSEYLAKDMVYFKDMASLIRTDDVFTVTDQSGNSKEVKLLTDASLLFIGTQDNGTALEVKENDIVSIQFDWSAVPDTDVKYCKITQTDGSFTAPTALFWLLVNKNEGTGNPPSMMLSRELTPYSDRQISIQDLDRIEITKNPTDAEIGDSAEDYQTKMTVYLKDGDQIDITTSKFIVFYAKAKDGLMHSLNNSRLSEIVFY